MLNKSQKLNFQSIDDLLAYLPDNEVKLVKILRSIVLECLIGGEEKFAYNVPYYYRHSRICYIWPASIPWGAIKSGVAFGFCKGIRLRDELNYLDKTNRKEIASKTFRDPVEIDAALLKTYIMEAIELDEIAYQTKKRK